MLWRVVPLRRAKVRLLRLEGDGAQHAVPKDPCRVRPGSDLCECPFFDPCQHSSRLRSLFRRMKAKMVERAVNAGSKLLMEPSMHT